MQAASNQTSSLAYQNEDYAAVRNLGPIDWHGGPSPVPSHWIVRSITRDGRDHSDRLAGQIRWEYDGGPDDVMAYCVVNRLVKPAA